PRYDERADPERPEELVQVRSLEGVVATLARDVIVAGVDDQTRGQLRAPRALEAVHAFILQFDAEVGQVGAGALVGQDYGHSGPAPATGDPIDPRADTQPAARRRLRRGLQEVALPVGYES